MVWWLSAGPAQEPSRGARGLQTWHLVRSAAPRLSQAEVEVQYSDSRVPNLGSSAFRSEQY